MVIYNTINNDDDDDNIYIYIHIILVHTEKNGRMTHEIIMSDNDDDYHDEN